MDMYNSFEYLLGTISLIGNINKGVLQHPEAILLS